MLNVWWHWRTIVIIDCFNTLRLRQNGRHFPEDNLKRIFLNQNVWISIKISLKFVPRGPINNFPALVQIMAWRRPGDKPLSAPMMVRLPTHICVTRPQWVKKSVFQLIIWNKHWIVCMRKIISYFLDIVFIWNRPCSTQCGPLSYPRLDEIDATDINLLLLLLMHWNYVFLALV